ncbi:uncharacterized protein LOC131658141 [Vicia villosa]|uniref:uncharacterized protein LOC131658141 n=1 Tax=Vicia villosa TaxID=3911 RepID=UPI00273B49DA|nr:uncharacterized protein LOC131658141 [Vicia villosa]
MDPRADPPKDSLSPYEGTKKIQIGEDLLQVTYLGVSLDPEEETEIVEVLRQNIDLFAWKPSDMPDINPNVMFHHLALDPGKKPVSQRKCKGGEEKIKAITEEVRKLLEAKFIKKISRATYQRLMDKVFASQIGRNLEVYVDDMVVKTPASKRHIEDLAETFRFVRSFDMRLNPEKCTFGVQAGKFLGFMLTSRGIEANPEKCQAILDMRSPSSKIEVQQLTGRLVALSQFLSCVGDKAIHFFAAIRKAKEFEWTPTCEEAFLAVKKFLSSPPILTRPKENSHLVLYLSVTDNVVSSVLVQDGAEGERSVYHGHKVTVKTNYPIKKILMKPYLAGRMVTWGVELSEYDIQFTPRTSIKSQALADFMVVLSAPNIEESINGWTLHVDGSSNLKGSRAGIASNNQAKYEALIAGMKLTEEVGVTQLTVKMDSQLIASQVKGEYQAKDVSLHRADVLARLARTKGLDLNKTYLTSGALPDDSDQALGIKKAVVKYTLIGGKVYRMGQSTPMLRCVSEADVRLVMMEVHEGACDSHIVGRALVGKILRVGQVPVEALHSVFSPWQFYQWGADILGPFPIAPGQLKFLIIVADYFTKWIEAEAVARISTEKVHSQQVKEKEYVLHPVDPQGDHPALP